MLRFTIYVRGELSPGDLTISAEHVLAVVELEYEGYRLAQIWMLGGRDFFVCDPRRDVADRIAEARNGCPGLLERDV